MHLILQRVYYLDKHFNLNSKPAHSPLSFVSRNLSYYLTLQDPVITDLIVVQEIRSNGVKVPAIKISMTMKQRDPSLLDINDHFKFESTVLTKELNNSIQSNS